MKVAVEGCCHGELDKIYESIQQAERLSGVKVDLLLICGDFQAVRNKTDMTCMAVPSKYQQMNNFHKYYSGECVAPVLTIFIGGNHEASNYLQELPYGGWVAPNIYYMGYAGVVQIGGLRIGGLSGISKERDYMKGHYEKPPYDENTKRSVYHVRNLEVFRLKQITRPVDIFLSHDWPRGVYNCGNVRGLLQKKKFFMDEIEQGILGSRPAEELLHYLQPAHWFSAHLHVKFAAVVQHEGKDGAPGKLTKFLALDKCLPRRKFLQILDIPHDSSESLKLQLDPEWLAILKSTDHLWHLRSTPSYLPGCNGKERWDFSVSDKEINDLRTEFGGDLTIPHNFTVTAPEYDPAAPATLAQMIINPQTKLLCTLLDITNPFAVFLDVNSSYSVDESNNEKVDEDGDIQSDNDGVDDDFSFINSSVDSSQSDSFLTAGDTSLDGGSDIDSLPLNLSASLGTGGNNSTQSSSGAAGTPSKSMSIKLALADSTSPSFLGSAVSAPEDDDELAAILALQKKALGKIEKKLTRDQNEDVSTSSVSPSRELGKSDKWKDSTSLSLDTSISSSSNLASTQDLKVLDSTSSSSSRVEEEVRRLSFTGDDLSFSPLATSSAVSLLGSAETGEVRQDSPLTGLTNSGKKLKRRNLQMYSSPEEGE